MNVIWGMLMFGNRLRQAMVLSATVWLFPISVVMADDGVDDSEDVVNVKLPTLSRPALHGRLILDSAFYSADKTAMGSGADVSNARISINGKIESLWDYVLQYELTGSGSLKNGWLRYRLSESQKIKIGQFQEPFSLDELTSSRYTTFIDQALSNAFAPGYHVGAGFEQRGRALTLNAGLFGEAADTNTANEGKDGWGATARMTIAPIHHDQNVLHLGMSGSYRKASSEQTLRFRTHPESAVTTVYLVNTDKIAAVDSHSLLGVEGAWVSGPWSLQSEYMRTVVNRSKDSDLVFDGGYLYASWFVTGESRPYSENSGTFGRINPKGGGAWELAARYSYLDLTDGAVHGGEERNTTLGVNYYFNPYIRCMADYVLINVKSDTGSEHPSALLARLQFDF